MIDFYYRLAIGIKLFYFDRYTYKSFNKCYANNFNIPQSLYIKVLVLFSSNKIYDSN